jgi:prophage regulatory protein
MQHHETITAHQPAPVILRIRDVQARTGLSRPCIYRLIQRQRFPAGVDILGTGRAVGWSEQAVSAWINERLASGSKDAGGV